MDKDTCAGCSLLKQDQSGIRPHGVIYCEKSGLNISGTLERSEKCKRENWKV
jgi:hypothetical protein